MFDFIPTKYLLVFVIVALAYAPSRYVWWCLRPQYGGDGLGISRSFEPAYSPVRFAISVSALVFLIGLAIFIFTPAATKFAESPNFLPIIMIMSAATCLFFVTLGLIKGQTEILMRGFYRKYSRRDDPWKFWLSIGWNSFAAAAFAALAFVI